MDTRKPEVDNSSLVFGAITLGLCGVGLAVVLGMAFKIEGGSVADWVAAFATIAAVIAAVYAGVWAKRAYAIEEERQRDAAARERMAQASQVAAWFVGFVEHTDNPDRPTAKLSQRRVLRGFTPDEAEVHLRNLSSIPVSEVRLALRLVRRSLSGTVIQERTMRSNVMPLLPPTEDDRESRFFDLVVDPPSPEELPAGRPEAMPGIRLAGETTTVELTLHFRDSANQKWTREPGGRLLPQWGGLSVR